MEQLTALHGVTGILLAGGNSCRMGQDKGFCLLDGKPMVTYGLGLLRQLCGQVLISANAADYEQFGHPVVRDEFAGIGPIGGLYSALSNTSTEHNFVISCDMPMLRKELFELLLHQSPGHDAVVPVFNGHPEPLAAYYRKDAGETFLKSIRMGAFKLQDALAGMRTRMLDMSHYPGMMPEEMFVNLNTVKELESLEKIISKSGGHERTGIS